MSYYIEGHKTVILDKLGIYWAYIFIGREQRLSVTGVKINLLKEVGELSDKKVKKVFNCIKESYPNIVRLPFGITFANQETREHVFITPGQITVGAEGYGIVIDFSKLKEVAIKIFDSILLEANAGAVFNYTGLFPSESSSMDLSLQFLDVGKRSQIDRIPEILGLGLRFIYSFGDQKGDFKVEPFLRDSSKFFMELEIPVQAPLQLEQIFVQAQELFSDFTGRLANFANDLIKQ